MTANPSQPAARRWRLHALRVAALLISTTLTLAVGEAALRIGGYSPSYINALGSFHDADPVSGHRGKRNFAGRFKTPQFDVQIVHNEAGFRQQEFQTPESAAAHRLFVFGDSFVWGWGVGQGEVFTDQLSRRLPAWRVENFGINGTGTVAQYELFAAECRERLSASDVVLVTFFANDFADNVGGTRHAAIVDGKIETQPAAADWHATWQGRLQETSYLFNCLSYTVNRWQLARRVRRAEQQAAQLSAAAEEAAKAEAAKVESEQGAVEQTAAAPAAAESEDTATQPSPPAAEPAAVAAVPPAATTAPAAAPQGVVAADAATIPGDAAAQVAVTRHYLAGWREDCEKAGARLIVVYIPGVTELDEGGNLHMAKNERAFRETFFACATAAEVETLDLRPGMLAAKAAGETGPLVIAGDGHWTVRGHQIVADIVAARLVAETSTALR